MQQNETIVKQDGALADKNEKLTELNNKLGENRIKETNQNKKFDNQSELIVEQGSEVNNHDKKIEELQNKLLGKKKTCLFLLYFLHRKVTFLFFFKLFQLEQKVAKRSKNYFQTQ